MVASAVGMSAGLVLAPPATAISLPYADPNAIGKITLCDTTGRSITSGDIHVKPFVWRAVGSAAGTAAYRNNPRRTATMFGYQPIEHIDPTQWNGAYLTGSSRYTNVALPMAGATAADPSLSDLLSAYPPRWDGLIQLRIFLGGAQQATETSTYNASNIQINGDTWTLIDGGSSPCNSGTAVSGELTLPYVRALGTPLPNATTDAAPGPPGSAKTSRPNTSTPQSSVGATPTPTPTGANSPAAAALSPAAHAGSHSSRSGALVWGGLVVGVALAVGGSFWWRRGRRARPS